MIKYTQSKINNKKNLSLRSLLKYFLSMKSSFKKNRIIKKIFNCKTALPIINEIGKIEKNNKIILSFNMCLGNVID